MCINVYVCEREWVFVVVLCLYKQLAGLALAIRFSPYLKKNGLFLMYVCVYTYNMFVYICPEKFYNFFFNENINYILTARCQCKWSIYKGNLKICYCYVFIVRDGVEIKEQFVCHLETLHYFHTINECTIEKHIAYCETNTSLVSQNKQYCLKFEI